MPQPMTLASPSPDAQYTAQFATAGEIRFGPFYYSLSVDRYTFASRIFGDAHLWAPSSRLLAVQEWLTLDYSEGPHTALVIVDLARGREATVAQARKAFIVPESFDGSRLVYRVESASGAVVEHVDVDALEPAAWQPLA